MFITYNQEWSGELKLEYPKFPKLYHEHDKVNFDDSFNAKKDAAILAACLSGIINVHEKKGESGSNLLKDIVKQLEDTFISVDTNVELQEQKE